MKNGNSRSLRLSVRVQGRRKFKLEEYIEYFEDLNLSLTQKSGNKCHFAKVSDYHADIP